MSLHLLDFKLNSLTRKSSRFDVCKVVEAEIEGDELPEVFECVSADVVDQVVGQTQVGDHVQTTKGVPRQIGDLES